MKKLVVLIWCCFAAPVAFGQDATITAMEYYIDTDPGVGSGVPITFTSGASVSFTVSIPTASLSPGMHILVIRAEDQNGDWSIHESRAFYVSIASMVSVANVTAMEYFFDTDPGFGNGTSVSITAGAAIDVFQSIATTSLSPGFHVIHFRTRDSDNVWSVTESRVLFVTTSGVVVQATINTLEYFFDTDPGYGNGTPITLTSGTAIDMQALVTTTSLTPGFHAIHIRARDTDGTWGIAESRSFFIDHLGLITGVEYYFDTDPGAGNGTLIPVAPPQATIDIDVSIPTTSLSNGTHTLGMRIQRTDDSWSDVQTSSFTICTLPTADFAVNNVCLGTATSFTDNSSTIAGDIYQWDFDNNGTIDDASTGNTSYTYPTSGSFSAKLTIDRGGCSHTATVSVQVEPTPVPDAGADQNVCIDNATLAATNPVAGQTGAWTLVSGGGTITDPANPSSTFTGITGFSNTLRWTLTNSAAGCSSNDLVTIVSNQPIIAAIVNGTAVLGQTSNSNVQSTATVNPGDVLTTTIMTSPKKGIAAVLANGTINYTPNAATVGRDTVVYQLCNQCSRCSSNNLIIDILNNAPVISPTPINVGSGQNVNIDLLSIISDPNNNLDPSTLKVTQQPLSGAQASIDASYNLIIDYSGITFSGTDQVTIEVCDVESVCSSNTISIEVDIPGDPPITVYNAVSPNGDGKHDFFEIVNIAAYPSNHVYVFNRWGSRVFFGDGYDNDQVKFSGTGNVGGSQDLPAGTYFYTINLNNSKDQITGYLVLKR